MVANPGCTFPKSLLNSALKGNGGTDVQLSESLKQFLREPLMALLGTASTDLRPAIARGMGVYEAQQEGHLEIVFSSWQWPETANNIRETGRMAMTVASPSKYTCYQI